MYPTLHGPSHNKSSNKDADDEEASRNAITRNNLTDGSEGNNAEEAFNEVCDEKKQYQHSEADAADQADLPAEDSMKNCAVEKDIKSKNKSEPTFAQQEFKNLLVCNYCDEGFENEDFLRDHTSTEHRSGRIRYRTLKFTVSSIHGGLPPGNCYCNNLEISKT